jgi:hypothetical protein
MIRKLKILTSNGEKKSPSQTAIQNPPPQVVIDFVIEQFAAHQEVVAKMQRCHHDCICMLRSCAVVWDFCIPANPSDFGVFF